jgi:predicted TIM-barrel fold metal-dependent hydrolase
MDLDRRRFLRQTARAALATGTFGVAGCSSHAAENDNDPPKPGACPIIDTHQHLWDLSKFRLPWLETNKQLRRTFATKDYLQATQGLNVVKAVYMEVAVDPSQQLAEAEHVIELCRREDHPTVAAVIGGRPAADDFRRYITRFKDSPYVKGVRARQNDPELFFHERFVRGIRLLGELGMSFDLCPPPAQLGAATKLVDRCPHTRFILDHCGNADPMAFRSAGKPKTDGGIRKPQHEAGQWREDIARLAERQRVVCKISGIVARAAKGGWTPGDLAPIIDHCIAAFGPDRVMFGSDWPVCTQVASLRQWVEALEEVIKSRSQQQRRKLLHNNAIRFYGLA